MNEDELKLLLEDVAACPEYEHEANVAEVTPWTRWDRFRSWLRTWTHRAILVAAVTVWLYEVIHQAVRR